MMDICSGVSISRSGGDDTHESDLPDSVQGLLDPYRRAEEPCRWSADMRGYHNDAGCLYSMLSSRDQTPGPGFY